ncbi:MAG: hypothetical protein QOD13_548, partial [Thermoleophilaceae bacterium]|nr:hypothetical protein [Thermoleophilaceae bacterium]
MRRAGVAQSEEGAPGPGEARLLASGALLQQVAQGAGLLVLLTIVTILARRLPVAELGAYGLVASLAGYLLVLRNSVASSAVRAMAAAVDPAERRLVFSAAAALYLVAGIATGLLIAGAGLLIAGLILDGDLAGDARVGAVGLGALTAVGVAASVWLDALRAERQFVRAAGTEIAAVLLYLVSMLVLIFAGAGLGALIAASGALPLYSGTLSALVARRAGLGLRLQPSAATRPRVMSIVPTAGWLLVVELCNMAMYAFSRVILGAYRSPTAVGLFEGPVRAHNLLYALGGALAVPVVPTASRYVATEDERRMGDLAVRGTRYTLALFVPVCVTLIVLAGPILEAWLGERYGAGDLALAILVSYWLLYGGLLVTPGFLVGAGRAREVARIMVVVAASNLTLSLILTPELGLEGPAVGTAVPFVVAFPFMLRLGLSASGASLGDVA